MSTTSEITSESFAESPVPVSTVATAPTYAFPPGWTLADLQSHLGDVPLERIRLFPPPGYATDQDVLALQESKEALCELVDGVLVSKPMGSYESQIAFALGYFLRAYVRQKRPGAFIVFGESGPVRTVDPQVRMPDVCFAWRDRIPSGKRSAGVFSVAPDLAVEVLSPTNTPREMSRKLAEYFQAGTRLVWYIDPIKRTAKAYTAIDQCVDLTEKDVLDGRDVVPGFRLTLAELFEEAGPREE